MKMTNQVALTVSIFSLLLTLNLNAECNYPKKSFVIPQGSKSTQSEMVEVMGKVKNYQAHLGKYRTCIDDELKMISPELENYAEIAEMQTKKYNASIEDEEKLAEDWGAAVKAFKSQ